MAKKHRRSMFKKYDALRLVGQPMMVAGRVAAITVGGPVATVALATGAAMTLTWVGFDIKSFSRQRRKEHNRTLRLV